MFYFVFISSLWKVSLFHGSLFLVYGWYWYFMYRMIFFFQVKYAYLCHFGFISASWIFNLLSVIVTSIWSITIIITNFHVIMSMFIAFLVFLMFWQLLPFQIIIFTSLFSPVFLLSFILNILQYSVSQFGASRAIIFHIIEVPIIFWPNSLGGKLTPDTKYLWTLIVCIIYITNQTNSLVSPFCKHVSFFCYCKNKNKFFYSQYYAF